ncbi:DegT/DnrJ/EryC1/StrS aminotransferase family protein [Microbacterium sp.]|uniref:DegT/DnrJ/EryC1/StrS family aminotransferase n=1 Tax=Microbacterium sp. TaxID=51671 RepID=UPI00261A21DD|nr:DegT/DnrJ/EryC1/StrS family aminotransferase [Microbacterium sp.]
MIPISTVQLGPDVEARVLDVLRSGSIAQGPVVAEFEDRFASLVGARHAIAVNNGTTALVAALSVHHLRPGDEVVTSPFTFIATLNAILEAGATVRFADIGEHDFALDAESVESAVTDRTKVLMPVHLFGQTGDMDALVRIAEDRGLSLVEDAAQAHGAAFRGRSAGTFGTGCFSFYATKNLTTGEGGIITTADDEMARELKILRNQGMQARYEYVMAGHNYRMTDLQAALALPQIEGYGEQISRRQSNAAALTERLQGIAGLVLPRELADRRHVWHQYTLLLPEPVGRQEFAERLRDYGVASGIYYPKPVYDYDPYRERPDVIRSETPVAERVAARCISIPVHQHLSERDIDHIADAVLSALAAS